MTIVDKKQLVTFNDLIDKNACTDGIVAAVQFFGARLKDGVPLENFHKWAKDEKASYGQWVESNYDVKPKFELGISNFEIIKDKNGGIDVTYVSKEGFGGFIVTFTSDGAMQRQGHLSPKLGFQLDDKGRIKLEE